MHATIADASNTPTGHVAAPRPTATGVATPLAAVIVPTHTAPGLSAVSAAVAATLVATALRGCALVGSLPQPGLIMGI